MGLLPIIGSAVIGGALSAHAQKKQNKANQKAQAAQNAENARVAALERQQALDDDQTRFQRLRSSAEAAGFNPLTALQFGGTTSNLGSGVSADGFIANQVFDWGPTFSAAMTAALPEISGQADVARTREALEQDLLKVQTDALRASTGTAQSALTTATTFAPIGGTSRSGGFVAAVPAVPRNGRPVARPNSQQNQDRILVYAPNGNPMHIYASTAERLGYKQFDRLTSDEYMQFFGEASEFEIALNQDVIREDQARQGLSGRDLGRQSTGGGWTGSIFSVVDSILNWSDTLDNITIHNEQSKPLTPESVQWPSNMMPTLGPVR